MSPVDVKTLRSHTPRTVDGRRYPDYLRPFETYDPQLLPLVREHADIDFDRLSVEVSDPQVRSVLPQWLASAEWRGLIERVEPIGRRPRRYRLGPLGAPSGSES